MTGDDESSEEPGAAGADRLPLFPDRLCSEPRRRDVAKGLEQLFERILKAGGRYFFDEPGFTPEDSF